MTEIERSVHNDLADALVGYYRGRGCSDCPARGICGASDQNSVLGCKETLVGLLGSLVTSQRSYDPEERQLYLTHGVCPRCKKRDVVPGMKMCPECLEEHSRREAEYRKERGPGYRAEQRREKRQARIAQGLCPVCGKPAVKGQLCVEHYAKSRKKTEEEKERNLQERLLAGGSPQELRLKNGLCYRCDTPVRPGTKLCEAHYQKLMDNLHPPEERRTWPLPMRRHGALK